MELLLMEGTLSGDGLGGIEQIRKEVNALENGLRYLENRFADPEREIVSALDVFNQWKSRYGAISDDSITWEYSFNNVSINVDMRIVADTLCEWLSGMKRVSPVKVFGELKEDQICFRVELEAAPGGADCNVNSLPPGFIDLIKSNGGSYREKEPSAGDKTGGVCCFPVVH
ncbi:MAG: hypothetical protein P1U86_05605 [Verrucomicrobiales bacterium]|nr:hypothetical protein [Verrucomicrobiales bacterium]